MSLRGRGGGGACSSGGPPRGGAARGGRGGGRLGYGHRAQFKTGGRGIGFYAERSRRLVPVSRCPLMVDAINDALPSLRGLGEFAPADEVLLASDGARVVAALPGVRFDSRIVGRTKSSLSGGLFEGGTGGGGGGTLPLEGLAYSVSPP